jgi:phage-related minor tail protein
MTTRSLGNLVVRLALELAQYKDSWKEAEAATKDGAAKVDQANKGATQGADALKDALKRQTGAYGEAAGGALEYAAAAGAGTGAATALAVGLGAVVLAAGAAAVAAYQGAKEQRALTDSLILTGNSAGLVTGQLDQMALKVASSIGGNVGHAREVLAGLVGTGRFTVESLGQVGEAVQLVARYSGQTNEQVLKNFAGMADGVAKWAEKSNEAYHFLNLETYRYIKALEEQGDKQQAMQVTSEALSKHLGGDLTRNLGYLDQMLKGVTSTWAEFWAAAKGIGKDKGFAEQIAEIDLAIEKSSAGWMGSTAKGQAQTAMLEQHRNALLALQAVEVVEARVKQEDAQKTELQIAADKRLIKAKEEALTSADRLDAKLKQIRADAALTNMDAEELAKLEAATIADATKKARKGPADPYDALLKSARERLAVLELEATATDKVTEAEKQLAKYETDLANGTIKFNDVKDQAYRLTLSQIDANEKAAAMKDRVAKADIEAGKAREYHLVQLDKGLDKINAEIEKEEEHTRSLGLSKEAIAELVAAKLEDEAVSLQLKAIRDYDHNLDQAIYDATMRQAEAVRKLAQAKREGAAAETFHDNLKKQQKDWDKFVGDIDKTFHDGYMQMLQNGEEGWKAWGDSLVNTFKTTVADEIYKMFVKPIWLNFVSSVFGGGATGGIGNGIGNSLGVGNLGGGANLLSNGFGNLTAPGGAYYNVATSAAGQSLGLSNSAAIVGNNPSAYAPAGTQLTGASEMMGAAAPFAAMFAVFFAAYKWGMFTGEKRSGGQYGFSFDGTTVDNARRGRSQGANGIGATFLEGPDGGDAYADASKLVINSTVAGINDALKAMGSALTLTGFSAGYETSESGRGGVFAGGKFNTGATFGENGTGDNYPGANGASPELSLYEMWGAEKGKYGTSGLDLNGSPEKMAVDAAQSYLEAIQASVGLIPKIVAETFQREGSTTGYTANASGYENGEASELDTDLTTTRWLRVYDEEAKTRIRELGLLPTRIADLILDVDPEALSDEATKALSTKIQTLVGNVNGFRAIVDALPVEGFRQASFDIAASLVELQGGLEKFAGNMSSYVENFYSAEEKRQFVAGNIARTLSDSGYNVTADQVLSSSRENFRLVMDAYTAMGEAGLPVVNALLQVNGAFSSLVPAIDETTAAIDQEREAQEKLRDVTDAAWGAVERAIDAQRTDLQQQLQLRQEMATTLQGLFDLLDTNVRSLYGQVDATRALSAARGRQFIANALSTAQRTGYLPEQDALSAAIEGARGGLDAKNYGSQFEFQRDQLVLAGQLKGLQDLTGDQLTNAEAQLMAEKDQIAQLDALLASEKTQLDALRGIDTSVLSVAEAIANLHAAMFKESGKTPAGSAGAGSSGGAAFGAGGGGGSGATAFELHPGVWGSSEGQLTFSNGITSNFREWVKGYLDNPQELADRVQAWGGTQADIAKLMGDGFTTADVEAWFAANGIPAFAGGGDFGGGARIVGEAGPELELTGPARIFSASQTRQILGGGGSDGTSQAVVDELRQLRADNQLQAEQLAQIQLRLVNLHERWDGGRGIRTVAVAVPA